MVDSCYYYDDPSILDVNGQKRPAYADPAIFSREFSRRLKSRVTYFPDGVLKELRSAISFSENGRPIYPGTPLSPNYGRGKLGKWGPNHAADPVAIMKTRVWFQKRSYVLVVQRKDTGEYALPGGMVDPGESASQTAIREMQEEAVQVAPNHISRFFQQNKVTTLYSGINWNDPRNTYSAWMETCVVLFCVPEWLQKQMRLRPQPGETLNSRWLDVAASDLSLLYSDHGDYVKMACEVLQIHCEPASTLRFFDDQLHSRNRILYMMYSLFVVCCWYMQVF